jgi:hypothetical protein
VAKLEFAVADALWIERPVFSTNALVARALESPKPATQPKAAFPATGTYAGTRSAALSHAPQIMGPYSVDRRISSGLDQMLWWVLALQPSHPACEDLLARIGRQLVRALRH